MSAQANIVINDGKTTPVAHTFAPKGARRVNGMDVALWRDQSTAQAVGYWTITENHTPVNANGMEKFQYVIDIPTLEQASSGGTFVPPPTRAYGSIAKIEFWVHERASAQELADLYAIVKNFTNLTYVKDAIEKREAAW